MRGGRSQRNLGAVYLEHPAWALHQMRETSSGKYTTILTSTQVNEHFERVGEEYFELDAGEIITTVIEMEKKTN